MRPPSFELHAVEGFKKHKCETFIVRLQFYGKFYCPSALGTAASDWIYSYSISEIPIEK